MKNWFFAALLFSILFFLTPTIAQSENETLVVQARVTVIDGNVNVDDIQLVYGYPTENQPEGRHIAQLLDRQLSELYHLKFYLEESFPTIPESVPRKDINTYFEDMGSTWEATLYFPYFEDAEFIAIGSDDGNLMAFVGLREELCNHDSKCNGNENFLSCKSDCPLNKSDNYCYPQKDEVCDPDCIQGLDPDCAGKANGNKQMHGGLSLPEYYFILSVLLIGAFIVVYHFVIKRKKHSKR